MQSEMVKLSFDLNRPCNALLLSFHIVSEMVNMLQMHAVAMFDFKYCGDPLCLACRPSAMGCMLVHNNNRLIDTNPPNT